MLSLTTVLAQIASWRSTIDSWKSATKDYVIEEGTSNDWLYQKWNSGLVYAWHSLTTSTGTYVQTWNNLIQVSYTVTLPFSMTAGALFLDAHAGNGVYIISGGARWDSAKSSVTAYTYGSQKGNVSWAGFLIGKWE